MGPWLSPGRHPLFQSCSFFSSHTASFLNNNQNNGPRLLCLLVHLCGTGFWFAGLNQCKSDLFLKVIHYHNIQMLQVFFGLVSNNTCACVINLQSTFWEWQIFDPLLKSTQKTETTCWDERYIVQSFKQSQVNLQCFQHTFLQLQQASMSVLFLKKEKQESRITLLFIQMRSKNTSE